MTLNLGCTVSVATIQEGETDAVYFSVLRNGVRHIERQAQQILWQDSDAWQLDAALSIKSNYPPVYLVIAQPTGSSVPARTSEALFVPGDVGKVINSVGSELR